MIRTILYIIYLLLLIALEIRGIILAKKGISVVNQLKLKTEITDEDRKQLSRLVLELTFVVAFVIISVIFFLLIVTGEINIMNLSYSINQEKGTCCIIDSYQITDKGSMRVFIRENLTEAPFNKRSEQSYFREWRAHNLLYSLGLFKESTKNVDLDINEPLWRRIGYFILSLFYCS